MPINDQPIALRAGKKLLCPACGAHLTPVLTDGSEVDECTKCKGVWVDFLDENTFLRVHPQAFTIDELLRLRRLYEPYGKLDPVQYRKCPICEDIMYRRNWGGYSGVITDRCEKHGTWLDAGEPEKIRQYVALGGVDYEKLQYHDQQTADVNRNLQVKISNLDNRLTTNRHLVSRIWTAITDS